MLKNFLYLNEDSLESYLSAIEDGARGAVSHASGKGRVRGGRLGASVLSAEATGSQQRTDTVSQTDTPSARFERLVTFGRAHSEEAVWVEVLDPDEDLKDIGIGALVEIECEIYVPDSVKMLSKSGGAIGILNVVEELRPAADVLGLDTSWMPDDPRTIAAMKSFVSNLGTDLVLVGEPDGAQVRIAGKLTQKWLRGEVDGMARVVGKVSSIWCKGTFKPVLALPGLNLIPREQRREMEKRRPKPGEQANWLEGPAVMLDVLAVYR